MLRLGHVLSLQPLTSGQDTQSEHICRSGIFQYWKIVAKILPPCLISMGDTLSLSPNLWVPQTVGNLPIKTLECIETQESVLSLLGFPDEEE